MPQHIKSKIFALILILASISTASTLKAEEASLEQIKIEATKIAQQYEKLGWFSGSLLLAKDGEVFHQASLGFANIETKTKNTANTKYNLGSIAKNFTAILVLQQVEKNKLKLDDTLAKFKLGFPAEIANKITIRHLLHHRSGFRDIFTAEYRQDQMAFDTLDKKLALLRDEPLLFEPGSDQSYSNYGYVVLGAILERVTGQTFEALLYKNIFDQLNLSNTSFLPVENDAHQSVRYTFNYDDKLSFVGIKEHAGPDGGIEATTSDLQRVYRELFYGNKLLSHEKNAIKEVFAIDGEWWGSFGGGLGISSAIEVDLINGFEIVVLSNSDSLVAELISGRILSFIKTGNYPPVKAQPSNFAYQQYKALGTEKFANEFSTIYQDAGYQTFIGRTLNELGMQLVRDENWSQAFDIINTLVSLFPTAPQAYDSLAFVYYSKGDLKNAKSTFAKAIELNADFNSDYNSQNYQ